MQLDSTDDSLRYGVTQVLGQIYAEPRRVVSITEQAGGEQGASGSLIRYYDIVSENTSGHAEQTRMVTKNASLLERQIVQRLHGQGCAVPPLYVADVPGVARSPIFMPFLEARPPLDMGHPDSPLTRSVADGLAGIHAANRGQPPPWLPHTADDFARSLWLYAWRERWEENLADAEFAADFGQFTRPLETAMERLMDILNQLTAEGDSLTLLNVDLLPGHIRLWRGEARFIDWQQSSYGTLYLDLPNYFLLETALLYRDALARHGFEIPVMEFLERYREVGRYMGLRYLGYSLWRWAQGGEERAQGRWFLYYTLTLALRGR